MKKKKKTQLTSRIEDSEEVEDVSMLLSMNFLFIAREPRAFQLMLASQN